MGFKCGIVGLPNVGKSTLFNALTRASVHAENYPFCTIEPNMGVVPVPDSRLDRVAAIAKPQEVIPTTIEFVDIAGLVAGASKGEGLGNKFLAHIREVDAIAHVVRCFEDENVSHVSGHIDPLNDIEIVNTELAVADLETVAKALNRAERSSRAGDKEAIKLVELLRRVQTQLDSGEPLRAMALDAVASERLAPLCLLTVKPILYVANVSEQGLQDNPFLDSIKEYAKSDGSEVVAICAAIEAELAEMNDEEQKEFLADMGLDEPGLNRVIHAGYKLLGLQTFFTAEPKAVQAWTVRVGTHAPQAAGLIHTDFEHGFIRAEVTRYDDFVKYSGEHGAKEAGKLRLEGKDYIVQDGDVVHFRFNV